MEQNSIPGKGAATASMVLGIVSCSLDLLYFFIFLVFRSFIAGLYVYILVGILGVIGIFLAHSAKQSGYHGASYIAGSVMSWISAIIGAIIVGIVVFYLYRINNGAA